VFGFKLVKRAGVISCVELQIVPFQTVTTRYVPEKYFIVLLK
jgi:hypothetical protein